MTRVAAPVILIPDFATMTTQELVEFLTTWGPSAEQRSPTYEAIGRELATKVADDPARFSTAAPLFAESDPAFLWGLLHGLWSVANDGGSLAWDPLIDLFVSIGERWDSLPSEQREAVDHWGWVRREMAELVSLGLNKQSNGISYQQRAEVWKVLESLMRDPSPASEDNESWSNDARGPFNLALNSVRGTAMAAVFAYAAWVRRSERVVTEEDEGEVISLAAIPEVTNLLDRHLEPSYESSIGVRAIYGRNLPWLISWDAAWVLDRLDRFFPPDQESMQLRLATWNSVVVWQGPDRTSFPLLESEYKAAIERLGASPQNGNPVEDESAEALAEHIVRAYVGGLLELDPGGLVQEFFAAAPEDIRANAMDKAGEWLERIGHFEPDTVQRVQALWNWRLQTLDAGAAVPAQSRELAEFGRSFACGLLDSNWALTQLERVIGAGVELRALYRVVERLAEIADQHPHEVAECVDQLIAQTIDRDRYFHWRQQDMEIILRALINSVDAEVRSIGRACANRLVAYGQQDFRQLLNP